MSKRRKTEKLPVEVYQNEFEVLVITPDYRFHFEKDRIWFHRLGTTGSRATFYDVMRANGALIVERD